MRFLRLIPDWLIYSLILSAILTSANRRSQRRDAPLPPPALGPALPNARPSDPSVIVEVQKPASGVGTAFAIDSKGTWLTARHVVDSCDQVGLRMDDKKYIKTQGASVSKNTDTALINSDWSRPPLARDLKNTRRVGETGYFIGFPQGQPGEVAGKLMGRHRMLVRGRYRSSEPILAWAEVGRTGGLKGSLGGLSGGPAFDTDGEVIGLVAAESPRRGRIYTVAPASLSAILKPLERTPKTTAISMDNYGNQADSYRRTRRIAQVICLVQ
jgi:S1-C subfamily serine protease